MAYNDPAQRSVMRFETRRYASRCEEQARNIERADTLREVARLSTVHLPSNLQGAEEAREAQRRLLIAAEQKAKDLVAEHIAAWIKAEPERRDKLRSQMNDDWANLSGPLGHLRTWAQRQFTAAEQSQGLGL
ncbi:MAG TPA: hypothetical protein VI279_07975 [Rhodocyclaceae bacterium]